MIILPILTASHTFLFQRLGERSFGTWEWNSRSSWLCCSGFRNVSGRTVQARLILNVSFEDGYRVDFTSRDLWDLKLAFCDSLLTSHVNDRTTMYCKSSQQRGTCITPSRLMTGCLWAQYVPVSRTTWKLHACTYRVHKLFLLESSCWICAI